MGAGGWDNTNWTNPFLPQLPSQHPLKRIQACQIENSHPAWYFTPNPTSTRTPFLGVPLPGGVLSDATPGPLPVCDPASTDSRSGETGVVSPLLTASRLLASLSSTQSLEVILDSLRSVQLLRLCRSPGAGGGGAQGLASGRLYGGPDKCFMERCRLEELEPQKWEPTS